MASRLFFLLVFAFACGSAPDGAATQPSSDLLNLLRKGNDEFTKCLNFKGTLVYRKSITNDKVVLLQLTNNDERLSKGSDKQEKYRKITYSGTGYAEHCITLSNQNGKELTSDNTLILFDGSKTQISFFLPGDPLEEVLKITSFPPPFSSHPGPFKMDIENQPCAILRKLLNLSYKGDYLYDLSTIRNQVTGESLSATSCGFSINDGNYSSSFTINPQTGLPISCTKTSLDGLTKINAYFQFRDVPLGEKRDCEYPEKIVWRKDRYLNNNWTFLYEQDFQLYKPNSTPQGSPDKEINTQAAILSESDLRP